MRNKTRGEDNENHSSKPTLQQRRSNKSSPQRTQLFIENIIQYGRVYYAIGRCNNQRKAIIENAIKTEADTIYLPQYPHLEYLWYPNPVEPEREIFFKDFYNIPQNVSIVITE